MPEGASPAARRPPRSLRAGGLLLAIILGTVALLPGSRKKEIMNLLPDMLGAARILMTRFPDVQFVLPVAPSEAVALGDAT